MTTVLVVDDDPDDRWLLRTLLQEDGCNVLEAEDGEEALRALREAQPAIIVLDLQMPQLDGLRFLEAREREQLAPHAAVIIHTAHSLVRTPDDCYRFVKPLQRESFRWLVRALRERLEGSS